MSYSAADVGGFYDDMTDALAEPGAGNIHWGYWHSAEDPATFAQAADQMTDQMIARLAPAPGRRVLDIGCGTGAPAVRLARRHDVRVTGISVSSRQVRLANEHATAAGLAERVIFHLADAVRLPFADRSFDAVWAFETFSHVPDRAAAVREAMRVLRPGGRLAISDFLLRTPLRTDDEQAMLIDFCLAAQIESVLGLADHRALLERAGARVLESTDVSAHTRDSIRVLGRPFFTRPGLVEQVYGPDSRAWLTEVVRRFEPYCGYVLITATHT